jgi:hypothetical protein
MYDQLLKPRQSFLIILYFLDTANYLNDYQVHVSVRLQYSARILPPTPLTFPRLVRTLWL